MQREIVNSTAHPSRQPQHLVCWRMQKGGPLSKFGGSNGNFRIIQTSSPALCGRSNWITRTSPVMMKRGGGQRDFRKTTTPYLVGGAPVGTRNGIHRCCGRQSGSKLK